jgi:hypothetical protein
MQSSSLENDGKGGEETVVSLVRYERRLCWPDCRFERPGEAVDRGKAIRPNKRISSPIAFSFVSSRNETHCLMVN